MSLGLKVIRENGNIRTKAANNDGVSGCVMYMPIASLPTPESGSTLTPFSEANPIIKIGSIDEAEALGITSDAMSGSDKNWWVRSLWYHLNEAFRINASLKLYVGLYAPPQSGGVYDFAEIKKVQSFALGEIRQVGVYAPQKELASGDITALQAIATFEEAHDMPLILVYSPKVSDITAIAVTGVAGGNKNVSVVVAQEADTTSYAYSLFNDSTNTTEKKPVGVLGMTIGMISKAKVSECIGWVEKFSCGISQAGFVDGKTLRELSSSQIDSLEEKRLLYLVTYTGYAGTFFNDSYNQDLATSDYNAIERVRTMDKAVRGVREYLLPYLGSNIDIDQATGKIGKDTIAVLTNEGNRYLEDMEKNKELNGYKVQIDADQDVLSSSELVIVIKQVPQGVMRKITLKMSFATAV